MWRALHNWWNTPGVRLRLIAAAVRTFALFVVAVAVVQCLARVRLGLPTANPATF